MKPQTQLVHLPTQQHSISMMIHHPHHVQITSNGSMKILNHGRKQESQEKWLKEEKTCHILGLWL